MRILILALILSYPNFIGAQNRAPAVEPVLSISIEEQQIISAEKAIGFDFSYPKKISPEQIRLLSGKRIKGQTDNFTDTLILILFLSFLPLVVLFDINISIKQSKLKEIKVEDSPVEDQEAFSLDKYRNQKLQTNNEKIKDDLKKVS